jgi:hypothetical protein
VRAVPRLATFTLAFALQLRKKHGKTSVRVDVCSGILPAISGDVWVLLHGVWSVYCSGWFWGLWCMGNCLMQ